MSLELLVDGKILKILKQLLKEDEYTYVHKISRESKVAVASAFRVLGKLEKLKMISSKKIGNLRLYRINNNEITKKIRRQL